MILVYINSNSEKIGDGAPTPLVFKYTNFNKPTTDELSWENIIQYN